MNKKKTTKILKYDIFDDIIHWNSINGSYSKVNHYYIIINNTIELEWFCHFLNMKKISGLGRWEVSCNYDTDPKRFKTAQGGFNDEFPKKFVLYYNYGYVVSIDKINTDYYYAIDVNLSDTVQYFKFLNDINNNKDILNKYNKELTMIENIVNKNEEKVINERKRRESKDFFDEQYASFKRETARYYEENIKDDRELYELSDEEFYDLHEGWYHAHNGSLW